MNIEAEITALKLAFAYLYRAYQRSASIDQEVDDIMKDSLKNGGAPADLDNEFTKSVRDALTGLLQDCKYVGLTRPCAGEDANAQKIRGEWEQEQASATLKAV
jgi:hypothetical protein